MKDELDDDEAGAASSGTIPESTTSSSYSNPRASRNMAEKQRRDNLNTNISTMAALVPAVAGSSRRMDKISILRLSAAFLRTQYALGPGPTSFLPRQYNDFDLEQYIIENLVSNAGFFLVVTTSGKIVYISRHVEHQLGHAQNELLGQSLYNFVCPEDYEELQRNITPDEDHAQPSTSSANVVKGTDENSNSSDDPCTSPKGEKKFTEHRRNFTIRMSQKALNKRDHGQYECLNISGLLRLADACNQANNPNRPRHHEVNSTSNDIVFVGVARLVKRRTITELSLLEATKDEYVTRHLVDGRIIFCDHRISVVAGYMAEEVSGLSAFKFMHKEDVRWTMIGLRQMYDRGEGFGSSCYRLLSKTGEFIYLRTHGYLEFDKSTQTVESFVCINTLVSKKEGDDLVKEMKDRFSATITGQAKAMITPDGSTPPLESDLHQLQDERATVEDPLQLEDAINHLISDLPSPSVSEDRQSPSPLPNNQYYKAAIYSRGLPPASIQASRAGIQPAPAHSHAKERASLPDRVGQERRASVQSHEDCNNDDEDHAVPGTSYAQRHAARSRNSRTPEKIQAHRDDSTPPNGASDTTERKRTPRKRVSLSLEGGPEVEEVREVQGMEEMEEMEDVEEVAETLKAATPTMCPNVADGGRSKTFVDEEVARYARKRSRRNEGVAPGTVAKRKANFVVTGGQRQPLVAGIDVDSETPNGGVPTRRSDLEGSELPDVSSRLPSSVDVYQHSNPGLVLSDSLTSAQQLDDFEDFHEDMLSPSLDTDPDFMRTLDELQSVMYTENTIDEANVNQFTARDRAVNEQVRKSHFQLQKSIALRESQLSVLKRNLDNPARPAGRENFTDIEAEHHEHKQILKTLQQDHMNLQANVQHNIGV